MRVTTSLFFALAIGCGGSSDKDIGASGSASVSASAADSTAAGTGGSVVDPCASGGTGGSGGEGPAPFCTVKEMGTSAISGTVKRAATIEGSPACTSSGCAVQRLRVAVLDPAQKCTTSQPCPGGACMYGMCAVTFADASPSHPDFSDPGGTATYCTSNDPKYPALPPGDYHLFAFYDCNGDGHVGAGDFVSADPPANPAVGVAEMVVLAPDIVMDRACSGTCAKAFAP